MAMKKSDSKPLCFNIRICKHCTLCNFQVLHSVAKNALFKRAIMEQEYEFDILEDDVNKGKTYEYNNGWPHISQSLLLLLIIFAWIVVQGLL